jgi:hypothetical protein
MSMIGNYFAVTEQQVRSFQSKPDEVAELLEGEDVEDSGAWDRKPGVS